MLVFFDLCMAGNGKLVFARRQRSDIISSMRHAQWHIVSHSLPPIAAPNAIYWIAENSFVRMNTEYAPYLWRNGAHTSGVISRYIDCNGNWEERIRGGRGGDGYTQEATTKIDNNSSGWRVVSVHYAKSHYCTAIALAVANPISQASITNADDNGHLVIFANQQIIKNGYWNIIRWI